MADTILLVEDDELVASGIILLLKKLDFHVIWAKNRAEAHDAMCHPVSLLLSDFWLETGYTASDVLTDLHMRQPGVPWVVLTADPMNAQLKMPAGGIILAKPAKAKDLRMTLGVLLGQSPAPAPLVSS